MTDRDDVLTQYKDLFDGRTKREIEFLKEVLKLEEWKNPRFKRLLTPSILNSNIETI